MRRVCKRLHLLRRADCAGTVLLLIGRILRAMERRTPPKGASPDQPCDDSQPPSQPQGAVLIHRYGSPGLSALDRAAQEIGLSLTPAHRAQVAHEQMRMVLLHTRLGTVAATVFAVLLALHLRGAVPTLPVLAWLAVKVAVALARIGLSRAYGNAEQVLASVGALVWDGLQGTAIAQLWRGFATPQTAQNRADRAARDLFSVALACVAATLSMRRDARRRAASSWLALQSQAPS